jgi:LPXTG-site transpeptidase (sortase) family protein
MIPRLLTTTHRRAMSLSAAMIVVILLASCGGDSEEVAPTAPPTPEIVVTPTPVPATPEPPPLQEAHRIIIDKIGVNAPVATYGLDEQAVPVVPTGSDAAEVVAWYNFSARPGMHGNTVYAGHVSWNGPAVFKDLQTLAPGDTITLRDDRGAEAVYRVTENFSVDPNDPKSVEAIRAIPKDVITLVTCGGSFFDTGDPVAGGDYTQRVIVRGELVSVNRV